MNGRLHTVNGKAKGGKQRISRDGHKAERKRSQRGMRKMKGIYTDR